MKEKLGGQRVPKKLNQRLSEVYTIAGGGGASDVLTPHSVEKREAMRYAEEEPTTDTLPTAEDGWQEARPTDPEFVTDAVRVIRLSDGTCKKFFHVVMRSEALKQRNRRAKKLLRRIEREDREAERKAMKRSARLALAMMGKK